MHSKLFDLFWDGVAGDCALFKFNGTLFKFYGGSWEITMRTIIRAFDKLIHKMINFNFYLFSLVTSNFTIKKIEKVKKNGTIFLLSSLKGNNICVLLSNLKINVRKLNMIFSCVLFDLEFIGFIVRAMKDFNGGIGRELHPFSAR